MSITEAINVIEQALEIGRKAGAYSFRDSTLIFSALGVLSQLKETEENRPNVQDTPETQDTKPGKKK